MIPALEHKLCEWTTRALGAMFPPPSYDDFTETELRDLYSRNDWIDRVGCLACLAGMLAGLGLAYLKPEVNGWDVLLMFGIATAFFMATAVFLPIYLGEGRLREFLVYYSLKHGYHWFGVTCVMYVPLVAIGLMAAYLSYFA